MPAGRPTILTSELREKASTFLQRMKGQTISRVCFTKNGREEVEVRRPPTVTLLAIDLGVSRDTLYEWGKEDRQFSDILDAVKEEYETALVENGLVDKYNANLAKFLLSADHGKRERSDMTTDGKELPSPILYALSGHDSDKEDNENEAKD